mgnify:CR=1 FL=1
MAWIGDINEPRYPQRVLLAAIGLDANRYQQWIKRGVLRNPRGDDALVGAMTSHPGRGRERLYSALSVIKLAAVARVTDLGVPVSLAVTLAAALELALVAEDLQQIQDGSLPDTPMVLVPYGGVLQIHYWRPWCAQTERPLLDGVPAGIILDWRFIVQSTLERLAEVTAEDQS